MPLICHLWLDVKRGHSTKGRDILISNIYKDYLHGTCQGKCVLTLTPKPDKVLVITFLAIK